MKVSILICSVNDRFLNLYKLTNKLDEQIGDRKNLVEYRYLGDGRSVTIGEKREDLKKLAKGDYIFFIDDDDDISDDYVDQCLRAAEKNPDAITFECEYSNKGTGNRKHIIFGMDYRNHHIEDVYYRMPYHICGIKREIALQVPFIHTNMGEDSTFALELFNRCLFKTSIHIPKVLYFYKHNPVDSQTSDLERRRADLNKSVIDIVMVSNAKTREAGEVTIKAISSLGGHKVIVMEKHPKIVYLFSETYRQKGKFDRQRFFNEGASKGKNDVIVFTDNNVLFPPDFVHSVTKLIQEYDILYFQDQSGRINEDFCYAMTREAWNKKGKLKELRTMISVTQIT